MIEAGLPLDRALVILEELAPNARLRAIVGDLLKSIRGGNSLAEAMAKHQPRPFSRLAVNMVRAGEKGGVLEPTLKRLAELLEESQAFKETLVSALIYPIMLTLAGLGRRGVPADVRHPPLRRDLPRISASRLPLVTQILLSVSTGLQAVLVADRARLLLGIVFAVRVWLSTEGGRNQWDRIVLRLPLVGDVVLKSETARFTRVLGTLLKSGVPVLTALGVVRELAGNTGARARHRAGERGRSAGRRDRGPIREAQAFPAMAVHMVRVGEETGRLEDMLLKVASDFESEVRRLVKRLMGLLEPAIILIMGLIVGFIVVALLDGHLLPDGGRAMTRARLLARVWKDNRGFTLIEMIVVVIILGLLAGLVGPRLFGRVGQSKMVAARAQIELLGAALDQYSLDVGTYPPSSVGLEALVRNPNIAALERPVSQEERHPGRSLGQSLPVQVLSRAITASTISGATARTASPAARGRAPTSLLGRSSEPATGASCERDEARALWQPEAYVGLGELQPQARRADMVTRRARASHVEGCQGARNVAVRAEQRGCEARAEWMWRSKLSQWSRGFTLIELAVTLLVLSLAAAVVVPGIGRSIGSVRARAEISGFAAYLRAAREQAITRGEAQSVRLDPETRSLVITAGGLGRRAILAELHVPDAHRVGPARTPWRSRSPRWASRTGPRSASSPLGIATTS